MHYLFLVILFISLACTKPPATPAAPKTVLDEAPPTASQAVCGDGIVQGEEQCDDGNRVPWGQWVDGKVDLCDNNCFAHGANGLLTEEEFHEQAEAEDNEAEEEAQYEAMVASYKEPPVQRCFVQKKKSAAPDVLVAEVAKHLGVEAAILKGESRDLNEDGQPDWFVGRTDCSSPFGCMGSVFLASDCAPQGFCYAISGRLGYIDSGPQLKCRDTLKVEVGEFRMLDDPYCTFSPLPKACADPPE